MTLCHSLKALTVIVPRLYRWLPAPYLALRESAGPGDDPGGGGEVEMVLDGQHGEVRGGQLGGDRQVKPFRLQTLLIVKDWTDTKTEILSVDT